MTLEQKKAKIAEACRWTELSHIPAYFDDLNAMYTAEMYLKNNTEDLYYKYCEVLEQVAGHWECTSATAAERAEAFIKTLGLDK